MRQISLEINYSCLDYCCGVRIIFSCLQNPLVFCCTIGNVVNSTSFMAGSGWILPAHTTMTDCTTVAINNWIELDPMKKFYRCSEAELNRKYRYWFSAVFPIRIQIGSGFNEVNGSGFRIQIQEGKDDPQKKEKVNFFPSIYFYIVPNIL